MKVLREINGKVPRDPTRNEDLRQKSKKIITKREENNGINISSK